MALRTIRTQGDPVLEKVCRPITEVTPRIRTLAEDMVETMYDTGRICRGLRMVNWEDRKSAWRERV